MHVHGASVVVAAVQGHQAGHKGCCTLIALLEPCLPSVNAKGCVCSLLPHLDDDAVPWPYHVAGALNDHLAVRLLIIHGQLQQQHTQKVPRKRCCTQRKSQGSRLTHNSTALWRRKLAGQMACAPCSCPASAICCARCLHWTNLCTCRKLAGLTAETHTPPAALLQAPLHTA